MRSARAVECVATTRVVPSSALSSSSRSARPSADFRSRAPVGSSARTSPAGWIQALTTGTEGWDETWKFFRNSLASTLLFTSLFTLAWRRHLGFLRREAVALANPPQAG